LDTEISHLRTRKPTTTLSYPDNRHFPAPPALFSGNMGRLDKTKPSAMRLAHKIAGEAGSAAVPAVGLSASPTANKTVFVAVTGGFGGNGEDTTAAVRDSSGTEKIFQQVQALAKKSGQAIDNLYIQPGWTCGPTVNTALGHINKTYRPGDNLVLYGYSNGGRCAVDIATALEKQGTAVDSLITVDATDRQYRNLTVGTTIPHNAREHPNYYQRGDCGIIKCSRGEPHTAEDAATTHISNKEIHPELTGNKGYMEHPHQHLEAMVQADVLQDVAAIFNSKPQ